MNRSIEIFVYIRFLSDLRPFAPSEQEYKKLSFLLTLKRLQDHTDYHNWNPSAGRVQCFQESFPLIQRFLQVSVSSDDKSNYLVYQHTNEV